MMSILSHLLDTLGSPATPHHDVGGTRFIANPLEAPDQAAIGSQSSLTRSASKSTRFRIRGVAHSRIQLTLILVGCLLGILGTRNVQGTSWIPSSEPSPNNPTPPAVARGTAWEPDWWERILLRFSSQLSSRVEQVSNIQARLATLPRPANGATSDQIGFHSSIHQRSQDPLWVQIDLESVCHFDQILIVPAHLGLGSHPGAGYGFPVRFRVESSVEPEFLTPNLLLDFSQKPFPNPGNEPVFVPSHGRPARYLRITVIELFPRAQYHVMALGEVIVLSGNRNLAVGRPVSASSYIDSPRPWDRRHLVDNQSILGPPTRPGSSPSNGYHSIELERDPFAIKWVTVDLGRDVPWDEVRLIPARPLDWADRLGFGFPVRFRIETCSEADPSEWWSVADHSDQDYPNPGDNPVVFRNSGPSSRWIRVTATKLWERREVYAFALAELEVWSEDTNIALGCPVEASESHEANDWSTVALTDGYNSMYPLIPLKEWAEGLRARQEALEQIGILNAERRVLVETWTRRTAATTLSAFCSLTLVSGLLLFRARERRQRDLEIMRRRIARDMHDDLGARLTEITYLSELARQSIQNPSRCEQLNLQISDRARHLVSSLDELVWTVNPGNDSLPTLIAYLLRQTEQMLNPMPIQCRMDVPRDLPPIPVSSDYRYQILMLLKESLNNAIRHANPTEINLRFKLEDQVLEFCVEDNGSGLPEHPTLGHGIRNMEQRARTLHGQITLESRHPHGTRVILRIPLRNRHPLRNRWTQ